MYRQQFFRLLHRWRPRTGYTAGVSVLSRRCRDALEAAAGSLASTLGTPFATPAKIKAWRFHLEQSGLTYPEPLGSTQADSAADTSGTA